MLTARSSLEFTTERAGRYIPAPPWTMVQYNPNNLLLFSNVRITRDYSVVHDMTPETWYKYLTNTFADSDPNKAIRAADTSPPVQVFSQSIDYYRLPQTIRIQANYDTVRKATYGVLLCVDATLASMNVPSFKYLFFWVDSVRLVKQTAEVTGTSPNRTSSDVVELDITLDAWSNKFSDATLYDSYILRRHEIRWYRDHTDPDDPDAWVYHPRYFPNAADDVGGAYEPDAIKNIATTKRLKWTNVSVSPPVTKEYDFRFKFYVIAYLDNTGVGSFLLSVDAEGTDDNGNVIKNIAVYDAKGTLSDGYVLHYSFVNIAQILDGTVYTGASVNAKEVQCISAIPSFFPMLDCITQFQDVNGVYGVGFDHDKMYNTYLMQTVNYQSGLLKFAWCTTTANYMNTIMRLYKGESVTVDPELPEFVYDALHTTYSDKNEPMLYRSPATCRKITTGMGGTVINIPDIDTFNDTYSIEAMLEFANLLTVVYSGNDIKEANAVGNIGTDAAATLPIFESAWANYRAIQKTGDDIVFNAKQVSTIVGTATGAVSGAAGGAITGLTTTANPVGAVAGAGVGVAAGIIGGATQYWSNSEELRAKHETIKNSPCVVQSLGEGLGAAEYGYIGLYMTILKLDSLSFNKLRTQYYYYGYNVNMVVPGTIDTDLRKYFDYIETRGANIRGDLNAEEASQIAAIFDRGVRIYHGPAGYVNIGAGMSLENPEKAFTE